MMEKRAYRALHLTVLPLADPYRVPLSSDSLLCLWEVTGSSSSSPVIRSGLIVVVGAEPQGFCATLADPLPGNNDAGVVRRSPYESRALSISQSLLACNLDALPG